MNAVMKKERLHILLVDDEAIIHQSLGGFLADSGHRVTGAYNARKALALIADKEYDLAIVDLKMPGLDGLALLKEIKEARPTLPVIMITGHGSMQSLIPAMQQGAAAFLSKPVKLIELDAVIENALCHRDLTKERIHLKEAIEAIQAPRTFPAPDPGFTGTSPAAGRVNQQVREAVQARCDTILVTGETGAGKEVVARAIHLQADGPQRPFIAVSCPTLSDPLLESELFGHCRGAFTGADRDRTGYFELAAGGTLLLDEIADLSPGAQAALLRVLETRAFRRVGGAKEIKVAVRVVATTNIALEELVRSGKFRKDLYFRLAVYTIQVPALCQRTEDILPLAELFLARFAAPRHMHLDGFSPKAQERLTGYSYPGNARELRNIVENAAIRCRSGTISPRHLSLPVSAETPPAPERLQAGPEKEADRIRAALQASRWNRRDAARKLGLPYSTLRYKIKALGLDR